MREDPTPDLTALLGFVLPGWERADGAHEIGALAEAAATVGVAAGPEAPAARRFLSAAASPAAVERSASSPGRLAALLGSDGLPAARDAAVSVDAVGPGRWAASALFRAADLRAAAPAAVSGGWDGSRFERAFGAVPRSVAARAGVAAERPLVAPVLLATAADALVAESLHLARRLPWARSEGPDVLWRMEADGAEAWLASLRWLALGGPSALASEIVLAVPRDEAGWHARLVCPPPHSQAHGTGEVR